MAQVLGLARRLPADAADALAIAITHAWRKSVRWHPEDLVRGLHFGRLTARAVRCDPAQRAWAEAQRRATPTAPSDPRRRRGQNAICSPAGGSRARERTVKILIRAHCRKAPPYHAVMEHRLRVHTPAFAQGSARDEDHGLHLDDKQDLATSTASGVRARRYHHAHVGLRHGPKIALAAQPPTTPRRAVRDQDLATLQRIPGVGSPPSAWPWRSVGQTRHSWRGPARAEATPSPCPKRGYNA